MSVNEPSQLAAVEAELTNLREEYHNFIYAVSHDLSAPLRQIEGFIHIIQLENQEQFDEDTQRHFQFIVKASDKSKAILEALVSHSRLINTEFLNEPVDVYEITQNVIAELSELIKQSDAKLAVDELPTINGDSNMLHTLIYNLAHNALHYRDLQQSPSVSIYAEEDDKMWKFCIKDNGIGFRQKMADELFIALRRGVSEKKYSGLGMGLTIARAIVQRHGGEIWASSSVDGGTSVYFTLKKEGS